VPSINIIFGRPRVESCCTNLLSTFPSSTFFTIIGHQNCDCLLLSSTLFLNIVALAPDCVPIEKAGSEKAWVLFSRMSSLRFLYFCRLRFKSKGLGFFISHGHTASEVKAATTSASSSNLEITNVAGSYAIRDQWIPIVLTHDCKAYGTRYPSGGRQSSVSKPPDLNSVYLFKI